MPHRRTVRGEGAGSTPTWGQGLSASLCRATDISMYSNEHHTHLMANCHLAELDSDNKHF